MTQLVGSSSVKPFGLDLFLILCDILDIVHGGLFLETGGKLFCAFSKGLDETTVSNISLPIQSLPGSVDASFVQGTELKTLLKTSFSTKNSWLLEDANLVMISRQGKIKAALFIGESEYLSSDSHDKENIYGVIQLILKDWVNLGEPGTSLPFVHGPDSSGVSFDFSQPVLQEQKSIFHFTDAFMETGIKQILTAMFEPYILDSGFVKEFFQIQLALSVSDLEQLFIPLAKNQLSEYFGIEGIELSILRD